MSNSSAAKIKAVSLDELLGVSSVSEAPEEDCSKKIVEVPLEQLHSFKNHPFEVLEDEKMEETVESIRKSGILVPGIVRRREAGGYELISGHRRCMGARLAGLSTLPVLIKELTDAEATIIMVDSNIQREGLSYREKAFAYQMKYDALKEMGLGEEAGDKRLDQALAEHTNESRNTIQRYIRLTYLLPELLDMVDDKKIGFIAATDLSYLLKEEQEQLLEVMKTFRLFPTGAQAVTLKEYSRLGKLSTEVISLVLKQEKKPQAKIVLKTKQLQNYFPENYNASQMTDIILKLLEEWKQKQ